MLPVPAVEGLAEALRLIGTPHVAKCDAACAVSEPEHQVSMLTMLLLRASHLLAHTIEDSPHLNRVSAAVWQTNEPVVERECGCAA